MYGTLCDKNCNKLKLVCLQTNDSAIIYVTKAAKICPQSITFIPNTISFS